MVRIFNMEALLVHQANETCRRSYATISEQLGLSDYFSLFRSGLVGYSG